MECKNCGCMLMKKEFINPFKASYTCLKCGKKVK